MEPYFLLAVLLLPPILCLFLLATRGKTMLAWTKAVTVFGVVSGALGWICLIGPCIVPAGLSMLSQLGALALLGVSFFIKKEQFLPPEQKKRNCGKCGAEIVGADAKFCHFCGAKAQAAATPEKLCAKCGAKLGSGQNFCPSCGTKAVLQKYAAVKQFGFCGQCGSRLGEGTRFCAKCGQNVSAKGPDIEKKVIREVSEACEKKSGMPLALRALLAAILIVVGYSIYANVMQPRGALLNCEFELERVTPTGLSLEGVTLDATFAVYNPNRVPAVLDSMDYTIYVNDDVRLGAGSAPIMEFSPMQRTRFITSLYVGYSGALQSIWTRIATGQLRYKIAGTAHIRTAIGTADIPFTKELGG